MNNWWTALLVVGILVVSILVNAARRLVNPPNSGNSRPGQSTLTVSGSQASTDIHEIAVTLTEITNGSIHFFDDRGNPKLGYAEAPPGTIRIYSQPRGSTPVLGDEIHGVNRAVVQTLTKTLQDAADKHLQEIRDRRQAQARAEREVKEKQMKAELAKADADRRAAIAQANADAEEARRRAVADLAAYRDHYIGVPDKEAVAVLVVDEAERENPTMGHILDTRLKTDGQKSTTGLFKPVFVSDGLFANAFSGQWDALNRLPLTNLTRAMLLGHQSVQRSSNPNLPDLISIAMTLQVNGFSAGGHSFYATTLKANGAGLTVDEARTMAQDRVLGQLTNGPLQDFEKRVSVEAP